MYEELVERLQIAANWTGKGFCITPSLCLEAADAIEFLHTYKVAFENIISMGGWWLVGQDKNLYRMDVPMNWPPKGPKVIEPFPLPEPPKEE